MRLKSGRQRQPELVGSTDYQRGSNGKVQRSTEVPANHWQSIDLNLYGKKIFFSQGQGKNLQKAKIHTILGVHIRLGRVLTPNRQRRETFRPLTLMAPDSLL